MSKLTEALQKTLAAGPKKGKPVSLNTFTSDWGIDRPLTDECLAELIRDGIVKLDNQPADLSLISSIQVHAVIIVGSANTQLVLEETQAKSRLETGKEEVTGFDGHIIRAAVSEEKDGDAWTGFYILNVARMEGTQVCEELIADMRFSDKDVAWDHWDTVKSEFCPFAEKQDQAGETFDRKDIYTIAGKRFFVDKGEDPTWNAQIYEVSEEFDPKDFNHIRAELNDPVAEFYLLPSQEEDALWDEIENWWCREMDAAGLLVARIPEAAAPAAPTVREHILGNGTSIRVFDVESDQGAVDLMQASGYERVTLEIASIEDVETNLALEELAAKHGEIEIYSIYDPFVPADQSEYSYVVAVKPCAAEEPAPAAKPKRSK